MITQKEALDRLNIEREYEDKLVSNLTVYFISVLDELSELTPEQKQKIKKDLTIVMTDSMRHRDAFGMLAQYVIENDPEDIY